MKLTRVGVDLAKQVFQVHGVDRAERPVWCKRLKRSRWIAELERDVETRDLYDRRLAYVVVDGRRFDDELLRRGYARLLVIEPNRAHARELLAAELAARRARRGIWAACE